MKAGLIRNLKKYRLLLCWLICFGSSAFTGLQAQTQLDEYLKLAATQNPTLKSKFNLYLAALEKVEHVGGLPDPTISFGYFVSPVETRVGPQNLRISLRQMFPWMGTLKMRQQVATGHAKVRFEEFEAARNELFRQIKDKWLELYELKEEEAIMRANLDILKSYEPVTRTKYEANLVSLADLVRVQISIDNARVQLELLGLRKEPLLNDFRVLLNAEPGFEVSLEGSLSITRQLSYSLDSIMTNEPRVKALQGELSVMTDRESLTKLNQKPQIGVGLDYGFVGRRDDVNLSDNGKDFIVPALTFSLPIFKKKNKAARNAVAFEKESVKAKLEALENDLRSDWEHAEYAMESARREVDLYAEEIVKTEALLRILTSEYTNNNRDFEDLLAAQQQLLQLRLSEVRALVKYYKGIHKKDYLTGNTLNRLRQ